MAAHGIMFHHFHDAVHPVQQGSIDAQQFEEILQRVGIDRILSAPVWMEKAQAQTLSETDVCLTFDDSLRCQYDVAVPVLEKWGLTAFWFVYTSIFEGTLEKLEVYRWFRSTQFSSLEEFYEVFFEAFARVPLSENQRQLVSAFRPEKYLEDYSFYSKEDRKFRFLRDQILKKDRYEALMDGLLSKYSLDFTELQSKLWMSPENVKSLKEAGHEIGLHSHSHPTAFNELPKAQQQSEYTRNHQVLTKMIGEEPRSMSHPCNSYSETTLEILRKLGVQVGFRSNSKEGFSSSLEFPREDHADLLKRFGLERSDS